MPLDHVNGILVWDATPAIHTTSSSPG